MVEAPVRISRHGSVDSHDLRFRGGFVVGGDEAHAPAPFINVSFPIRLSVHPSAAWATAEGPKRNVCLIGSLVHPDHPEADLAELAHRVASAESTSQMQEMVDGFIGRFAFIYGTASSGFRVQADAIGMRMVCFGQAEGGRIFACSHVRLASTMFGLARRSVDYPVRLGLPGLDLPVVGLTRLPPNLELDLSTGSMTRIFPRRPVPRRDIREVWQFSLEQAQVALRSFAVRQPLLISLSAGLDTRTTLAALDSETRAASQYFTYNTGVASTSIDVRVATRIAQRLGLSFQAFLVHDVPKSTSVLEAVTCNAVGLHGHGLAAAYHTLFGNSGVLHVRTNMLENTRANLYAQGRGQWEDGPNTPTLAADYYRACAKARASPIDPYREAFQRSWDLSRTAEALSYASPWDLYFIEHRMGAWHANIVLESDVAFDTVVAFNSRRIIEAFWGVPQDERASSSHLRDAIVGRIKGIEDVPINPPR